MQRDDTGKLHRIVRSICSNAQCSKPVSAKALAAVLDRFAQRGRFEASPGQDFVDLTVDRKMVLERVGGDPGILKEIAAAFIAESPKWLAEMRRAEAGNDGATLERIAHTYKGAASIFGLKAAVSLAAEMELNASRGEIREAASLVPLLEDYTERVCKTLIALCEEESSCVY